VTRVNEAVRRRSRVASIALMVAVGLAATSHAQTGSYPSIPGADPGWPPAFSEAINDLALVDVYFPGQAPRCRDDRWDRATVEAYRCWQTRLYLGRCAAVARAAERALASLDDYRHTRNPIDRDFAWDRFTSDANDATNQMVDMGNRIAKLGARARMDPEFATPTWIAPCRARIFPLLDRIEVAMKTGRQ